MTADLSNELGQGGAADGTGLGVGALLREARLRHGLSLQEVGQSLKMQVRVLESLENERWEQLSAPVFIRGQLRSYARLLKVDIEPFLQQFQTQAPGPAELVSHSHIPPYQRLLENVGRRSLYVVLTLCFFAIPVWLATRPHVGNRPQATAPLDVVPADPAAASTDPIAASLAPLPRPAAPALSLRFNGESWVQIVAADGSMIEQGLVKAGEQRSYAAGQVGRVVVGNATVVEVQRAGSTVDTTPYRRANVARFTVSSDGSLSPVGD